MNTTEHYSSRPNSTKQMISGGYKEKNGEEGEGIINVLQALLKNMFYNYIKVHVQSVDHIP